MLLESIVAITVFISLLGWRDSDLMERGIGYPYRTISFKELHRLISSGFLHADPAHLALNMYGFYTFGNVFLQKFPREGSMQKSLFFLACYFGGIISANIFACIRHGDNKHYQSLGASAGVTAIMTSVALLDPTLKIGFIFLPKVPALIFVAGYLLMSFQLRNEDTRIAHDAHFVGGVFGILFTALLVPDSVSKGLASLNALLPKALQFG